MYIHTQVIHTQGVCFCVMYCLYKTRERTYLSDVVIKVELYILLPNIKWRRYHHCGDGNSKHLGFAMLNRRIYLIA